VQDVGHMESGAPYMVMEYLEGCDLKALVVKQGRLSVDDTVTYVMQVCEAMAEAHAAGIVHRDLKPANLFLVRRAHGRPCVKVLDFGISKQMGPNDPHLTRMDATLGSPLYMAPEQMGRSSSVDGRADIWALGVILYELLSGTSPFEGTSMLEVASRVLQEELTPLRDLRKDVPEGLEMVINKCLRKRREDRFQTVQELQVALARFGPPGLLVEHSMAITTSPEAVGKSSATIGEATPLQFGRTGKSIVLKMPRLVHLVAGGVWVVVIGVVAGSFWMVERESVSASVPIPQSPQSPHSAQTVIPESHAVVAPVEDKKLEVSAVPLAQPSSSSVVDTAPTTDKPKAVPVPQLAVTMKTRAKPRKPRAD